MGSELVKQREQEDTFHTFIIWSSMIFYYSLTRFQSKHASNSDFMYEKIFFKLFLPSMTSPKPENASFKEWSSVW